MLRLVIYLMFATALYVILRVKDSYVHLLSVINSSMTFAGPLQTALHVAALLVPVFKLPAAAGLLMKRAWAWALALVVLTVDVALRAQAAIRLHLHGGESLAAMKASLAKGAVVVHIESMWPSYIIAFVSLLSVMILLCKPVRNRFLRRESGPFRS